MSGSSDIAAAPFVLIDAKLHAPLQPEGLVSRPRLVELARANPRCKLVLVSAPVGYGKTTFLAEWAQGEQGSRPFAWVSLDPDDRDPIRLCAYVIEAVDRIEPGFGEDLRPLLQTPGADLEGVVLPSLANELASLPRRVVIVLDDYHLLGRTWSKNPTTFLLEHMPETVQLVISTRSDPPIPLGRLRASGEMMEIRASHLRFDEAEADALLRATLGIDLDREDLEILLARAEGWPAGLYLAALSLRGHPNPGAAIRNFAGDDRHVVDYLTEEVLERHSPEVRRFFLRTSVLERLTASLCDEVVGEDGSAELLERLERSNLFLVSLDGRREWYRYHHLFADLLRTELSVKEPELVGVLHRRASEWYERRGSIEDAVRHAISAGDVKAASRLVARHWVPFMAAGRTETLRAWLRALGEEALAADPLLALAAARDSALSGDLEQTERWLAVAERGSYDGPLPDGHGSLESAITLLRARYVPAGLRTMREAIERAVEIEDGSRSPFRGPARAVLGYNLYLSGEPEAAAERFEEAIELCGEQLPIIEVISLARLSLIASDRGRLEEAESLANEALRLAEELGLVEHPEVIPEIHLALGRVAGVRGRLEDAEEMLEWGLESLRKVEATNMGAGIQLLLTLVPVRSARGNLAGARTLIDKARDLIEGRVEPGILAAWLERVERDLRRAPRRSAGISEELSGRERDVLRMLPSGLSQREIGAALYLSFNTVHTHLRSVYRKLGASSRAEAVERARRLGLIPE